MSDVIITAVIGGTFSLLTIALTGFINYKLGKIHKQINSRMDELLQLNKEASRAKGNLEGRAEQTEEKKEETLK